MERFVLIYDIDRKVDLKKKPKKGSAPFFLSSERQGVWINTLLHRIGYKAFNSIFMVYTFYRFGTLSTAPSSGSHDEYPNQAQ